MPLGLSGAMSFPLPDAEKLDIAKPAGRVSKVSKAANEVARATALFEFLVTWGPQCAQRSPLFTPTLPEAVRLDASTLPYISIRAECVRRALCMVGPMYWA